MSRIGDFILWYTKNKSQQKYRQLYEPKDPLKGDEHGNYRYIQLSNGERRPLTPEERRGEKELPKKARLYRLGDLTSQGPSNEPTPFEFNGKIFNPQINNHWKANYPTGLEKLVKENRIVATGETLSYVRFLDDYPVLPINNAWLNTGVSGFSSDKIYVVQTNSDVISRCLLMTTDPGDLVLDITCGSGTTAYVAEQWGRRWITCDTSRIAITLAKKRLMTATFDYYKLAHPEQGVSSGFVYKTVPHITLKSIANNEPPEQETLYDQPEIEKKKVRISGPFTVEALPAPIGLPVVKPLAENEETESRLFYANAGKKHFDWMEELKATGILGKGGKKIQFSRVEALSGAAFIHAEAETKEASSPGGPPRRALIHFASENTALDIRTVDLVLQETENFPMPSFLIFAYFHADPAAANFISDYKPRGGITLLKVQMNTDLITADLKKKTPGSQSFWLVGQPDVELIKIKKGEHSGKYKVKVAGYDYYDVKNRTVVSGDASQIAMWLLDTDYDGMSLNPAQIFFPLEDQKEGWNRLAKTLKAEIDFDLMEKYHGTESIPFAVPKRAQIAVKIVDDRGIESMKVMAVGEK
ncbi:MAG: site-specific DNA-methyltransferase [Treponema sp.]|nr:site-specific DNA-methyltransferase [Treponema sp.]